MNRATVSDENMRSPLAATRVFGNSAENLALDGARIRPLPAWGPIIIIINSRMCSRQRWSANLVLFRCTAVYAFVPSDIRRVPGGQLVLPRARFRDVETPRTFIFVIIVIISSSANFMNRHVEK